MPNFLNSIVLSLMLLLAVNIVFLDIAVFSSDKSQTTTSTTTQLGESGLEGSCTTVCRGLITSEVSRYLASQSASSQKVLPTTVMTVPQEYYITLGSGMTRSSSYDPLPGAKVFINSTSYPRIQKVIFEVYLRNPTGNGSTYAKLYNVTDKHDVWFSEVSFIGGGSIRREATIQLTPGDKEYQVMLKSTLSYDVYVDNARVKITTY